uniref:Peptidase S1 domain-containing protein n=1 Tax=Cyanistes caeruleus TaxID=156563 RepID=A0A8C0U101_CYACU
RCPRCPQAGHRWLCASRGTCGIQANLENGTWHMCSGALIHPQWVLTVARCFIECPPGAQEELGTWGHCRDGPGQRPKLLERGLGRAPE